MGIAVIKLLKDEPLHNKLAKKALAFIEENKDGPFFLYFASPVPHAALQVPEDQFAGLPARALVNLVGHHAGDAAQAVTSSGGVLESRLSAKGFSMNK